MPHHLIRATLSALLMAGLWACGEESLDPSIPAEGVNGLLGEPRPNATPLQRVAFSDGEAVAKRRFSPEEGLGPLFTLTFCAGCHEKPVFGGGGGRYRDFFIHGQVTRDGAFIPGGERGGILSAYGLDPVPLRPGADPDANTFAVRNPIPFFGIGLLAEVSESSILKYSDPDDRDGDGISGRPNYDRGFVGRFGTKAQTVSIEGFVRGPIFNHLGITSDPLSDELRAQLPVPSVTAADDPRLDENMGALTQRRFHQAAAPSEPLNDDDDIPDPELSEDDLFAIVSWVMLLAAPEPDPDTPQIKSGRRLFHTVNCTGCHVPYLSSPRGAIYAYSDLLLHDMGDDLADGIEMGVATGREFRTAPLWGVSATGPYLHDGRADTLDAAIRLHDGEARASREAYEALGDDEQADLIEFLTALGGREQTTEGLIPPNTPIPDVGAPGGPHRPLFDSEPSRWLAGRSIFDRDLFLEDGLGPLFNGDSCRACHFDPIPGGSGPVGVNAMRFGEFDPDGQFIEPDGGTNLAKLAVSGHVRPEVEVGMFFESRQTPTVLGAGLLDLIPPEAIVENADPEDLNEDGIRGVAHILSNGQVGRFGWKAQIPSLEEFSRDAVSVELGLTVPPVESLMFGTLSDDDAIGDPEISLASLDALTFYVSLLAPPAPKKDVPAGRRLFEFLECTACHIPRLTGLTGEIPAYTDLLLHTTSPDDRPGVADGQAGPLQYRTPPLWGLSDTGPYMHDGSASTVRDAILAHAGEAQTSRDAFAELTPEEQAPLLEFLENL